MARIAYPDPAALPEAARSLYDALAVKLNIFRMVFHAETCVRGFMTLGGAILQRQQLDARLRELAILRVAALSRARYEWTQHVAIARAVGVSDAEIDAMETGELAGLDPVAVAITRFTEECVRDVRVSDPTFSEARRHLCEREITELLLTIGFYMMVARLLETLAIDHEEAPPQWRQSFRPTTR
ncbi:4-carboxymuconolactone decarboxylase [Myxococcaceae bacterium]|jgi:alkylhydroperoxidase family enzyme|nr:4-carboxymuconolactone decarboxylase [Myxococcaceae bacterium]